MAFDEHIDLKPTLIFLACKKADRPRSRLCGRAADALGGSLEKVHSFHAAPWVVCIENER